MLLIITGPSGVGKTTIIKELLKAEPNLRYSVSLTTRQPRADEVDGVDYHFVSRQEFLQKIKNDEFVEWSEVYGEYYGRLKSDLDELALRGDVVVGIDIQGALKLLNTYPEGVFVFLLPKSESALESQLRKRGTDDEESIKTRLDSANREMMMADKFDYRVVNDKITDTVKKVQSIMTAERCRTYSGRNRR